MRLAFAGLLLAARSLSAQMYTALPAPSDSVRTIHAARMIDGRGHLMRDAWVDVQGGRIIRVYTTPKHGVAAYELGDATLLPGLIDAHVHPADYINRAGVRHSSRDADTPAQSALARAGNLYAMLLAGFTTVQSVGSEEDLDLRDAVTRWQIPGPRLLTSLTPIEDPGLSTDSLRALVHGLKARGADVVKIIASDGLSAGGTQRFSDAQLAAICGEANAIGIRAVVHAMPPQSVRAATLAGCTGVEHGTFAGDAELQLMAAHGTIFDPQVCLVLRNYLDNRAVFSRSGMDSVKFDSLAMVLPAASAMFARAVRTPGLKLIFGTDAVSLAYGHGAEEFACRVRAGQSPMDAITSATSSAADALRLGDRIGTIAPGFDADIIAVRGNPDTDITALERVVFVMRGGAVFK